MPGWQSLLVIVIASALASAARAEVYKWTDEQGVVHYGDKAPAQQPHELFRFEGYSEIEMRENIRASESVSRGRRALNARIRTASRNTEETDKKQDEAHKHEAHCQTLVRRIESINSRLRAGGYPASQGNRLRAERRELSGKRAWECLRN